MKNETKTFNEILEDFAMHIMEMAQKDDVKLSAKVEAFTAITRYYKPESAVEPKEEKNKVRNFKSFKDQLLQAEGINSDDKTTV